MFGQNEIARSRSSVRMNHHRDDAVAGTNDVLDVKDREPATINYAPGHTFVWVQGSGAGMA